MILDFFNDFLNWHHMSRKLNKTRQMRLYEIWYTKRLYKSKKIHQRMWENIWKKICLIRDWHLEEIENSKKTYKHHNTPIKSEPRTWTDISFGWPSFIVRSKMLVTFLGIPPGVRLCFWSGFHLCEYFQALTCLCCCLMAWFPHLAPWPLFWLS